VFVDPSTMPGWLQAFVNANPVSQLCTAARDLMHGTSNTEAITYVLIWSVALVVIFAPLTMRKYNSEKLPAAA
jgi:ABC-2 type transport system permease protein